MPSMPTTPAAMRTHLTADPPAGHGMTDADMPMAEMVTRHGAMHDDGAGHEHTMMSAAAVSARKAFTPHEFKLSETGEVTVAFSRFGVIDSDNDVTFPGSMPVGKSVPMSAYGHTSWDGALPTGKGTIAERGDLGIFDGSYFMETDQGRNAYHTTKAMAELQEWSYGYAVLPPSGPGTFGGKRVRELRKLDVFEVSPVLRGAGVGTATLAIKSGAPGPDAPTAELISWHSASRAALMDRLKTHYAARGVDGRELSRVDQAMKADLEEALRNDLDALLAMGPPPKAVDPVTMYMLVSAAKRLGVTV